MTLNAGEMKPMNIYAHTRKNCPPEQWELLYGEDGHASKVQRIISSFPIPFKEGVLEENSPVFRILGGYHDMGKATAAFQQYLLDSTERGGGTSVNHKTAAARWFWEEKNLLSIAMAYVFEGHHSGLPCGTEHFGDGFHSLDISEPINALPPDMSARPQLSIRKVPFMPTARSRDEFWFQFSLLIRMLHSSLVDADWLATEAFMEPEQATARRNIHFDAPETLSERLEKYIAEREGGATGRINALRKEIHHACRNAAEMSPGVFQLNVPTGGGKTLSSLSFALEHACRHGLERVIYVIPFTSIIEQTAQEFRSVLGADNVVEHQSNIATELDTRRNRYAAENWDAPLVVTTSVQFFESLYSAGNRRCRKLHNIAHSVIVFDEAQSLPSHLLHPCLAAMKGLHSLCGCSLVLCTATQPLLTNHEGFNIGWNPGEVRSLLGPEFEQRLAREMKRVEVIDLGEMSNADLIGHFLEGGVESALFIVNLTRQAQELFQSLQDNGVAGLYHLSARMCPAHRLDVLTEVRARLKSGLPTVLVSTRVVEAGVDVSFPVVYRDRCGLDALAQSAGRCNRHGEAALGQVFSYGAVEKEYALPASFADVRAGVFAREDTLSAMPDSDPFSPQVVENYFAQFYNRRRNTGWDSAGVMPLITNHSPQTMDFPAMEEAFKMIPGGQFSVIVPYGERAEVLRNRLLEASRFGRMPSREDYREIQQLSVSVYTQEWERLAASCDCIHEEARIYMLSYSSGEFGGALYDAQAGLLREPVDLVYIC